MKIEYFEKNGEFGCPRCGDIKSRWNMERHVVTSGNVCVEKKLLNWEDWTLVVKVVDPEKYKNVCEFKNNYY